MKHWMVALLSGSVGLVSGVLFSSFLGMGVGREQARDAGAGSIARTEPGVQPADEALQPAPDRARPPAHRDAVESESGDKEVSA